MAIRVKLQINFKGKKIRTAALANAGYETDENEILIPKGVAKKLGRAKGQKVRYSTAGGDVYFRVIGKGTVKVITEDKESSPREVKIGVSPYTDEVIINDKLLEDLGIELLKIKKGIWRFFDDSPSKQRESEPKQSW